MAARVTGHVRLRKFKRGGSAWYVKYRLADGRQVQRLLGPAWTERSRPPVGYFTRKLAEEKLQEILSDARRGTLPDSKQRSGKTFDDACSEWLRYIEHEKERAASTVRDYTKVVNGALLPEFGKDTPLEQITTDRINTYRERLLDEGELSRRTIQKILVLLFGVLKRAKRRGWIPSNPDEDVERVTVKRSGDFNVLGMFTAPGDLVFCTELGEYVNDDRLRERFYAALAAAGLGDKRAGEDPMVFHDLRHTFGTLPVEAWPLHDVQAYMGHADIQSTMIYVHHRPKTAAADRLSQLVSRTVGDTLGTREPEAVHEVADLQGVQWPGQDSNLRATDYESQLNPAYAVFPGAGGSLSCSQAPPNS
jgi:site-specific recombinase XerD